MKPKQRSQGKTKERKYEGGLSLYPLTPDEALRRVLSAGPMNQLAKGSVQKRAKSAKRRKT